MRFYWWTFPIGVVIVLVVRPTDNPLLSGVAIGAGIVAGYYLGRADSRGEGD